MSIVCDYSSDSSNYQSESLYPIHSVTSCSTAEPKSSMSFSDTYTKDTHINDDDDCIEEPNLLAQSEEYTRGIKANLYYYYYYLATMTYNQVQS